MSKAMTKNYDLSVPAGTPIKISKVVGEEIKSRIFSIQNNTGGEIYLGGADFQGRKVPAGGIYNYVDVEGGGGDAEWSSEEIFVKATTAGPLNIEYAEFIR